MTNEDMRDQENLFRLKKQESEKLKQKYAEENRTQLKRVCVSKIRTTMIGALASFEAHFSDILDDPQFKDRYNIVREEILDLGNKHIRNTESEIEKYDVIRRVFKYVFKVKE